MFTSHELKKEVEKILKMLQKKDMPYRNRNFDTDTNYNFMPRGQVWNYLHTEGYLESYDANNSILTKKGKKFKSFKREQLKEWYKNLPETNWLLADVIKYAVIAILSAVIATLTTLQCTHQLQQPQKLDTSKVIVNHK